MSADAGDSSWEFEEGEEIVPGRYALRRLDRYPQLADEPGPADGVDAPLAKLVRSCLAYEPQQRPAPAELTDAFESLLGTPSRVRVRRS